MPRTVIHPDSGSPVELGDLVKDSMTGFRGIAFGRSTFLTGCDQILIIPACKEDGTKPNPEWLDADRLIIEEKKSYSIEYDGGSDIPRERAGGPSRGPARA